MERRIERGRAEIASYADGAWPAFASNIRSGDAAGGGC
jgi:hypothetical protein